MRIAVCRPQVPFAYGGAEIFTDTLVEQLRARGHEAEIVSVPFKWYPGTRVLTQAFTLAAARPDRERRAGRSTWSSRRSSRRTSCAIRRSESGSCTSSGRRTSSTAPSWGSSARAPEDRALRRKVQDLDRVALGEATPPLRHLGQRRRPAASARRGSSPRCCRIPAQALDYRDDGPRRLRPLRQPARPREARSTC